MKILMSLIFYPRGGSAQVARYLSRALTELGHEVRLITGTLLDGDPQHDAKVFFGEIPLTLVDYTDAWHGFDRPPIVVPPTVLVQRPPEAWGEGR